jgi:phosphoribosylaminoimidazole-succinocarboxamide synthase
MAARCSSGRRRRCRWNASRAGISRARAGRITRKPAPSAGSLPHGLRESDRFATPIFTPATKAESGHDENISEAEAGHIVAERIARLRDLTLAIYQRGVEHAETCGIIIADTKFEFGLAGDELVLIDEVLTPDSSRFWPKPTTGRARANRASTSSSSGTISSGLAGTSSRPCRPCPMTS